MHIRKVLHNLISEDQTGFMSNRYIGDNIRILYNILYYTLSQHKSGMFLRVDFEKAFDSISWSFIHKTFFFWFWIAYYTMDSCFFTKILNQVFLLMGMYLLLLIYKGGSDKETHYHPIYSFFVLRFLLDKYVNNFYYGHFSK